MHTGLGDGLLGPAFESFGAAIGIARRLPLGAQGRFELGHVGDACAQVVFESLELASEIVEQLLCVDQGEVRSMKEVEEAPTHHVGLSTRAR